MLNASNTFSNVLVRSSLKISLLSGIPLRPQQLFELFFAREHVIGVFQFDFDAKNLIDGEQNAFISHGDGAGHRSLFQQQQTAVVEHSEELSAENGVVCAVDDVEIQSFVWIGLGFFFGRKLRSERRGAHAFCVETRGDETRCGCLLEDRVVGSRIIDECGGDLKIGIIGGVVWFHLNVSLNAREDSKTCVEILFVFKATKSDNGIDVSDVGKVGSMMNHDVYEASIEQKIIEKVPLSGQKTRESRHTIE